MVGRPLRLEVDELVNLKPPCVLHWNLSHYVVLKKAWNGPGGVWAIIHDPARGVGKVTFAEIGRSVTSMPIDTTVNSVMLVMGDMEPSEQVHVAAE